MYARRADYVRMSEDTKLKSLAGRALANLRWSRTSIEERLEVGRKLAASRRKARKARRASEGK